MQFIDLRAQQALIRDQLEARIKEVLNHGQYILGPEVEELENKLAEFVGVDFCIGVSSGTDALLLALMALDVGPGDEIITTPFSFFATVETIMLLGATPVFVDIEIDSYNIDPSLIEAQINDKTKVILPVSIYGQCADFTAISEIANRHGIPVIEDAAQSFGASHHGRKSCALSDIACTSFFPSKPLGAYGDAGALFTSNREIAQRIKEIRGHGEVGRYQHHRVGINGRLDSLQAAILLEKLKLFPKEIETRATLGKQYTEQIVARCEREVCTPVISPGNTSVFAQYTIRVEDRELLAAHLASRNIPTAIHYPKPLYRQPALEVQFGKEDPLKFKNTEVASRQVLSLPMHPYLTDSEIEEVAIEIARGLKAG